MVGRWVLVPKIGVRVPVRQQFLLTVKKKINTEDFLL
jgi:hypothetical protein